jgi:drug/metabolite transporter (DMT)-like permease
MIRAMGPLEWLLLIALSILWGGSFFFQKVTLAELPPFTLVLGRVAIAATALMLVVHLRGLPMPRSGSLWGAFLIMGLLNNLVPFSLIVWGQTQITSGLASILNATTPLFTVVLAHWLTTDERMTVRRIGGTLLGLLGVTIMIGPEALQGLGLRVLAQLAVLAAAASYALSGIFGKRFKDVPPLVTAAGQMTGTTAMMLPIAAIVDRPWTLAPPHAVTWSALVGLGLLSTALAYVIYFRILATAGATNLLLVTLLIPVSALLLGTSILGERLEPRHLAGMALIALGLVTSSRLSGSGAAPAAPSPRRAPPSAPDRRPG